MPTQIPFEGPMLGAALTIVGLLVSWVVWRRRGAAAGLRGVAWSLLPLAAGLMGLMSILWRLVRDLAGFFAGLVFNPVVWAGVAVAAVAVVLWVVSGVMRARGLGVRERRPSGGGAAKPAAGSGDRPAVGGAGPAAGAAPGAAGAAGKKPRTGAASSGDDDFSDIEELLRRRGIG
ncbi:cellulose synthase [Marinitenerispora sediminis]|uniref:Cellulose synthase n=1 Tax=Marinitenerispora sediminis TaxID=1931232 RepID=A0A368T9C5_9ACTN|nr:cellulose synthase [Marinitenerispora sediminis]RCV52431.1 cellulose synthase [Marinitenerispora sediminis]RCV60629.1 cellulose synthase [Marinitenerispora sediminis]RCV61102.1 cellulose synthase [Marinitenerispora sediminis]